MLTKQELINRAWQSLELQCEAHHLSGLDSEQVDALGDVTQWPDMLDDMEARCGLDVSEARELLTLAHPVRVDIAPERSPLDLWLSPEILPLVQKARDAVKTVCPEAVGYTGHDGARLFFQRTGDATFYSVAIPEDVRAAVRQRDAAAFANYSSRRGA